MKSIPSNIHSIYLGQTFGRQYQHNYAVLGPWTSECIRVVGLVRVIRKHRSGYRYQQYVITDDIVDPQGDRLYFLLEVSGSRVSPQPLLPPHNGRGAYRSFLVANSCRTLWVVENHPMYWNDRGTAFDYDLELVNAEPYTSAHSFHPSVIGAAKEAIEKYAGQAYEKPERAEHEKA